MMTRERVDLGFDLDADVFDPSEWAVGSPAPRRPKTDEARKAAEATGFRSREVKDQKNIPEQAPSSRAGAPKPRRRRTGRNAQFNLKARPETIEQFCEVADAQGWGLGETLEYAVVLLKREYGKNAQ